MSFVLGPNFILFPHDHAWENDLYLFFDTAGRHYADDVFAKYKVPVKSGQEFINPDEPYVVLTCKVSDKKRTLMTDVFQEISRNIQLTGHKDYPDYCHKQIVNFIKYLDNQEESDNES